MTGGSTASPAGAGRRRRTGFGPTSPSPSQGHAWAPSSTPIIFHILIPAATMIKCYSIFPSCHITDFGSSKQISTGNSGNDNAFLGGWVNHSYWHPTLNHSKIITNVLNRFFSVLTLSFKRLFHAIIININRKTCNNFTGKPLYRSSPRHFWYHHAYTITHFPLLFSTGPLSAIPTPCLTHYKYRCTL